MRKWKSTLAIIIEARKKYIEVYIFSVIVETQETFNGRHEAAVEIKLRAIILNTIRVEKPRIAYILFHMKMRVPDGDAV